jgi:hypothetical protein
VLSEHQHCPTSSSWSSLPSGSIVAGAYRAGSPSVA